MIQFISKACIIHYKDKTAYLGFTFWRRGYYNLHTYVPISLKYIKYEPFWGAKPNYIYRPNFYVNIFFNKSSTVCFFKILYLPI